MRMIIAGSRSIVGEDNYARLKAAVMSMCSQPPSEIISGGAKGPDQMGERLAAEFGIPVKVFHPDWDGKGKGAGFIRNGDMAVYASEDPSSILVAMWDGESRGTAQMIEVAKTYGLRVEIVHPAAGIVAKDVTPKVPYIFGQSYSSLNVFETCPRQYEAKYITKEVKFVQSKAAAWGDQVHTVLENYLKMNGNSPIPSNMQMYQPFGDWVLNRAAKLGGQVLAERQAAVDRSHKPVPYKQRWIGGKIDVTILYPAQAKAEVFDWKGLALDTPLPTPTGWTTMGEVEPGDQLIGGDGKTCVVTAKSSVRNRPCYEVRFDDNSTVVADDEHLWPTNKGVISTERMKDIVHHVRPLLIPIATAIDLPDADLPIHPYLLGAWLGDGKHTSGEITKPDEAFWRHLETLGFTFDWDLRTGGKCPTRTVYGLRTQLRVTGLLGNKHVPTAYLRAGRDQRLALLHGLMDTDGHANVCRKQAVFSTCDLRLARSVEQLLLSLGQRPMVNTNQRFGFGKTVTAYDIAFRPIGINPFALPRKADKVDPAWGPGSSARRQVVAVTPVDSVPTQCVAVDSSDNTYLCGERMLVTHNTGKVRNDATQLKLYGGFTFADYPEIETASAGYIWLEHKTMSPPVVLQRSDADGVWNEFEHKYSRLQDAYVRGVFPPTPNGLCRQWCDVTSCEFHGKGRS